MLFAGASGTGKTMAAQVLAAELGLDLYQVDLATIVSKYIGETEKNLDRIFGAADGSNAILFFDEADALFGKRSEVKDAHDRYANIEVAYLLQKMEDYAGAVILATNLRRNIDDAFVRRMHFVVDFPLPEAEAASGSGAAASRRGAARRRPRLRLPGPPVQALRRHIRNCSLSAAFLAADDDGVIGMRHLVRAVALEYGKQGRLTLEADFEKLPRADPARLPPAQRLRADIALTAPGGMYVSTAAPLRYTCAVVVRDSASPVGLHRPRLPPRSDPARPLRRGPGRDPRRRRGLPGPRRRRRRHRRRRGDRRHRAGSRRATVLVTRLNDTPLIPSPSSRTRS